MTLTNKILGVIKCLFREEKWSKKNIHQDILYTESGYKVQIIQCMWVMESVTRVCR